LFVEVTSVDDDQFLRLNSGGLMVDAKPPHHLIKTLRVLRPELVESGVKALLRRQSLAIDT